MQNLFQFVPSEDGKFALFIYAREGKAEKPQLHLLPDEHKMVLRRRDSENINLEIDDETLFAKIKGSKKLLVCEVLPAEHEDEVEIITTYLVDIT